MALVPVDSVFVGHTGIDGDRAYALVDTRGHLLNGKRVGVVATITPRISYGSGLLTLRLPDGREVSASSRRQDRIEAQFGKRTRMVRRLDGPYDQALSELLGVQVHLVRVDDVEGGTDRGPSVTLLSSLALQTLARAGGASEPLDARRFRMTFGIEGVAAHAEDSWIGRRIRMGTAVVGVAGNVGRCVVTNHDPDSGLSTFDTLGTLHTHRGSLPTTEALPFGVWARTIKPGRVQLGDAVEPLGSFEPA